MNRSTFRMNSEFNYVTARQYRLRLSYSTLTHTVYSLIQVAAGYADEIVDREQNRHYNTARKHRHYHHQ